MVSRLGVAEPLPGLAGAEPEAERPSGSFALSAVWVRALTDQRDLLAELSVEVLNQGPMALALSKACPEFCRRVEGLALGYHRHSDNTLRGRLSKRYWMDIFRLIK